jgi:hypothetical protein
MSNNQDRILGMNRNAFTNYIVSEVSNHPAFDEAIGQNMNLRNKLIAFGNKRPVSMDAFADDLKNIIDHLRRVKASGKAYVRGSDIKDLVYLRKLVMAYKNSTPKVAPKKKRSVGGFFKSLFGKK